MSMLVMLVAKTMTMIVAMMVVVSAAAQQQHAGHIDQQSEGGDRDRFVEADRNRRDEARDGLVSDQQRDHGEHDRAAESREVAELAGSEREPPIVRVPAGVAI